VEKVEAQVTKAKVAIIMGSKSDLEVMEKAGNILDDLGVPYSVKVVSAHRTPQAMLNFAETARKAGIEVIIAGAGGAAHLPGMVAATATIPVIGVPVQSRNSIAGMDSVLSILQMPPGVPVATMALNGAENAGIFAAQILSLGDPGLAKRLLEHKEKLRAHVDQQNRELGPRKRKSK
jgi:5-(carboxyamino)imidazole ribonucleotide mutase